MDFEFGKTKESEAFFGRHPRFLHVYQRLMDIVKKCFDREYSPKNRLADICFNLGRNCSDDYLEILFLAANGFGAGATKLLRGLYERAVTLYYLAESPQHADRFVNFAVFQDHKLITEALKDCSEEALDNAMKGKTTVAEVRTNFEKFNDQVPKPQARPVDVFSMVREVGGDFPKYYFVAYVVPNLLVHASLASAFRVRSQDTHHDADRSVALAHAILLLVLKRQNKDFSLNLEEEITACEADFVHTWNP